MKIQIDFDTTTGDAEEPAFLSIEEAAVGHGAPLLVIDRRSAIFEVAEGEVESFFSRLDDHAWCYQDSRTLDEQALVSLREILDQAFAQNGVEFATFATETATLMEAAVEAVEELGLGKIEVGVPSLAALDAALAPVAEAAMGEELRAIANRIAAEFREANDEYNASLDDPNEALLDEPDADLLDLRPAGF